MRDAAGQNPEPPYDPKIRRQMIRLAWLYAGIMLVLLCLMPASFSGSFSLGIKGQQCRTAAGYLPCDLVQCVTPKKALQQKLWVNGAGPLHPPECESASSGPLIWTAAALVLVAFGIVVGFVQIGSPAVQRSASEDARRLFDLSSIAETLHARWRHQPGDWCFALDASEEVDLVQRQQ